MMDYLKFDCRELALQGEEFFNIYRHLNSILSELGQLGNTLEKQITSYESVRDTLSNTSAELYRLLDEILNYGKTLESVAGIYYSAEISTRKISENLPTGNVFGGVKSESVPETADFTDNTQYHFRNLSEVINNNIILEDWLRELIYKSKQL